MTTSQDLAPNPTDAAPSAGPAPSSAASPTAPRLPSVHERALVTWLAIFPLVALGLWALGPVMDGWHPVLRALGLTLVVVPLAVYVVVPRLMAAYLRARARLRK